MADRRVRYILEVDYDGGGAALRAADDLREVDDAARAAGDGLSQAESGFSKMQASIVTASSAFGIAQQGFETLQQAAQVAYETLAEGTALVDARGDFEDLAASIGTTADALESKLGAATGGLVTNAQLVGQAGELMALGLSLTEDEIVKLSELAAELDWDFQALTDTLNTGSTRGLKNMGLSIDEVKAKVAELQASGMAADEAFQWAIIEAGEAKLERVGRKSEETAGQLQQMEVIVANVQDEFARGSAEGFAAALGVIAGNAPVVGDALSYAAKGAGDFAGSMAGIALTNMFGSSFEYFIQRGQELAEVEATAAAATEERVRAYQWLIDQYGMAGAAADDYAASTESAAEAGMAAWQDLFQEQERAMATRQAGVAADWGMGAWATAVEEGAARLAELTAMQEEWLALTAEMEAAGGDAFTQMWQSDEVWDFGAALYNAADAAGAGAGPLGDLAVSLGLIDEATADAATAQVQAESIASSIAQAAVEGKIAWEEYAATVERAIEVINGAQLIDLGPRQAPEMDDRGFREGWAEQFEQQTREMSEYFTVRMDADVTLVESAVATATGLVEGFAALNPEVEAQLNIMSVTNGAAEVRRIIAELPSRKEIVIDVTVTGMGIVNQLQALGALP